MTTGILLTISEDGNESQILVQNPLEDLWHDHQYFIQQAKVNSADAPETMFLHSRFLRASLLFLFAYAEGVTSAWTHEARARQKQQGKRKDKPSLNSLAERMDFLTAQANLSALPPNLKAAKEIRNLWVHFTNSARENDASGNIEKIFDGLSLTVVEQASTELLNWMSQVANSLGVECHPDSGKISSVLTSALGHETKSANSKP
ncbi:MAG: hypothetical protein WAN65_27800 [Candidatus Sulfotelmatobacter sp.]